MTDDTQAPRCEHTDDMFEAVESTRAGHMQAGILLALKALEFEPGDWPEGSAERHYREQIELVKGHLTRAIAGEPHVDLNELVKKFNETDPAVYMGKPLGCSGNSASCENNEGYGCYCSAEKATLYAVHVHGPDSILAAESKEFAEQKARELNAVFENYKDVYCKAEVIEWPYERESHASACAEADWTDIG